MTIPHHARFHFNLPPPPPPPGEACVGMPLVIGAALGGLLRLGGGASTGLPFTIGTPWTGFVPVGDCAAGYRLQCVPPLLQTKYCCLLYTSDAADEEDSV